MTSFPTPESKSDEALDCIALDDQLTSPPSNGNTLVAVCTYQEAQNIERMLFELRAGLPDATLLVVDDNSPDGTSTLVEQWREQDPTTELIVRKDQRGLGSAIVQAMKYSIENRFEYFLNLDADLSHDPKELPQLLSHAKTHPDLDVVIGSRYAEGGQIVGWPLHRRLMSKMINRFATTFLRLPVKDCSGSMRCYRVAALQRIGLESLQCTGYAVLEEILVRLHRAQGRMDELPITFTERELGQSKLTFREAIRSIRFMLRLAVTRR